MKNTITIIFLAAFISACINPKATTKKAAIVLYNKTSQTIEVKALLNNNWSPLETTNVDEATYLVLYETNGEDKLPTFLHAISVSVANCTSLTLDRDQLTTLKTKAEDGRAGWNINIEQSLLKHLECKTQFK